MPRTFAIYDDSDQIAAVKRVARGPGPRPAPYRAARRPLRHLPRQERAAGPARVRRHRRRLLPGGRRPASILRYQDILERERRARLRRHPHEDRRALQRARGRAREVRRPLRCTSSSTSSRTRTSPSTSSPSSGPRATATSASSATPTSRSTPGAAPTSATSSTSSTTSPTPRVVILDQNYRSTQTILDSAHSVIAAQQAAQGEEPLDRERRRRPDRRPRGLRRGGRGALRRPGDQAPAE